MCVAMYDSEVSKQMSKVLRHTDGYSALLQLLLPLPLLLPHVQGEEHSSRSSVQA